MKYEHTIEYGACHLTMNQTSKLPIGEICTGNYCDQTVIYI